MDAVLRVSMAHAEAKFQMDLGQSLLRLVDQLIVRQKVCASSSPAIDESPEGGVSPETDGSPFSVCGTSPHCVESIPFPTEMFTCTPKVKIRRPVSLEDELKCFRDRPAIDPEPADQPAAFVLWASNVNPFEGNSSLLDDARTEVTSAVERELIRCFVENRVHLLL